MMNESSGPVTGSVQWMPVSGAPCRMQRGGARRKAGQEHVWYIKCHPERLADPLLWPTPQQVQICEGSDLFHDGVPVAFIDQVFMTIALATRHWFHLQTNRLDRLMEYLSVGRPSTVSYGHVLWGDFEASWPLPNLVLKGPEKSAGDLTALLASRTYPEHPGALRC